MKEKLENTLGCAAAILFLGFGIIQLGAGWAGIIKIIKGSDSFEDHRTILTPFPPFPYSTRT